jgi:hypothetical protein
VARRPEATINGDPKFNVDVPCKTSFEREGSSVWRRDTYDVTGIATPEILALKVENVANVYGFSEGPIRNYKQAEDL